MLSFAALDFETANNRRDSACAVGLVRVENGGIVAEEYRLINPQTYFLFTSCHHIRPEDVADAPLFGTVWPELAPLLDGVQFIAAHNSSFDRSVLESCCRGYQLTPPPQKFVCTLKIARQFWKLKPAGLGHVCRHLGVELQHHQALSDARASAHIVLRAIEEGYAITA